MHSADHSGVLAFTGVYRVGSNAQTWVQCKKERKCSGRGISCHV